MSPRMLPRSAPISTAYASARSNAELSPTHRPEFRIRAQPVPRCAKVRMPQRKLQDGSDSCRTTGPLTRLAGSPSLAPQVLSDVEGLGTISPQRLFIDRQRAPQ